MVKRRDAGRALVWPAGWLLIEGGLLVLPDGARALFTPALFAWVHFAAGRGGLGPGLVVMGSASLTACVLAWAGLLPVAEALARVGFVLVFGGISLVTLAAEVRRLRAKQDEDLEVSWRRVEAEGRDFRLFGSVLRPESQPPRSLEERARVRTLGSVQALADAFSHVSEIARQGLGGARARIWLVSEDDEDRIYVRAESPGGALPLKPEPLPLRGALRAVVQTGRHVLLERGRPDGLGFDPLPDAPSFLGVPLLDGTARIGVLAVEAKSIEGPDAEPFLRQVAAHLSFVLQQERLLDTMDEAKNEQDRFLGAFGKLVDIRSVDDWAEQSVRAVHTLLPAPIILALVCEDRSLEVRGYLGPEVAKGAFVGHVLPAEGPSLIASALRHNRTLPHPSADAARAPLIPEVPESRLEWLRVIPLVQGEARLGAIVLGSRRPFPQPGAKALHPIEVLASQAAVALANAQNIAQIERQAATDGLTGVLNHRRFEEVLAEALARADRFESSVALLMVDADHFKAVNDTYGHPVGDEVLRAIARHLEHEARKTDAVARYGGEEFAMVLEKTDIEGALKLAERVRSRIGDAPVRGAFGEVPVTVSIGVSAYPEPSTTAGGLIADADAALYKAKQRGRNRVERGRNGRLPRGGEVS